MLIQLAEEPAATSMRIIIALLCVIVASSLALGVSVGLARRIAAIGEQGAARRDPAGRSFDHDDLEH